MKAKDFFGGRECTLSFESMCQLLQMSASFVGALNVEMDHLR